MSDGQPGGSGGSVSDAAADSATCASPDPSGCLALGCGTGSWCDSHTGCAPSSCTCLAGAWSCSDDCAGGSCVPFADGNPSCGEITQSIAKQTQITGSCTAVMRFAYQSLALLGHQVVCGKYAPTDVATAQATALQATTFGKTLLSAPAPDDEWVFYDQPSDMGGVAAVSARTGLPVFGGGVVWAGKGEVTWPKTWQHTALGEGCEKLPMPSARGFALGGYGDVTPLPAAELDKVLSRVATTALPLGLAQWGYLFDAMVFLYRPAVGSSWIGGTAGDEYVVLLNSGWLE